MNTKKKNFLKKLCYPLSCLSVFFIALSARAEEGDHPLWHRFKSVGEIPYDPETDPTSVAVIIGTIIYWFMSILGIIFMAFMIYAGYLWLSARGNKETVDKSRKIMTDAIIGLAIVLGAAAITSLVYMAFVY